MSASQRCAKTSVCIWPSVPFLRGRGGLVSGPKFVARHQVMVGAAFVIAVLIVAFGVSAYFRPRGWNVSAIRR